MRLRALTSFSETTLSVVCGVEEIDQWVSVRSPFEPADAGTGDAAECF